MANVGNLQVVLDLTPIEGAGYAAGTDALKILSDVLDLIEGGGFATATDSLKILSDVLDQLKALHGVPGADVATNTNMRDVLGNKTDALKTDVAADVSAMAYLKGQVQELDQRKIPHTVQGNGGNGVYADIVNINDKGVLTGISVQAISIGVVPIDGNLRVTIDGNAFIWNMYVISTSPTDKGVVTRGLNFNHRFDTSLLVEGSCADTSKGTIKFLVNYTVDD